jgi:NAD(P)-dependent dehydrogenase (short-subunit alcohol dehydrogenase family)
MAANVTSLFLLARAAVRQMRAQEPDADGSRGVLLAMSSALARHPSAAHFATHAYAASKGAIESLTRAVAAAYAPQGIRMNAIAPSLVATPMSERAQADPDILAYLREKQPLAGGPIAADAVTPVALHLLSRESRMITGQVIAVDAGWSVSEPGPPAGP